MCISKLTVYDTFELTTEADYTFSIYLTLQVFKSGLWDSFITFSALGI